MVSKQVHSTKGAIIWEQHSLLLKPLLEIFLEDLLKLIGISMQTSMIRAHLFFLSISLLNTLLKLISNQLSIAIRIMVLFLEAIKLVQERVVSLYLLKMVQI